MISDTHLYALHRHFHSACVLESGSGVFRYTCFDKLFVVSVPPQCAAGASTAPLRPPLPLLGYLCSTRLYQGPWGETTCGIEGNLGIVRSSLHPRVVHRSRKALRRRCRRWHRLLRADRRRAWIDNGLGYRGAHSTTIVPLSAATLVTNLVNGSSLSSSCVVPVSPMIRDMPRRDTCSSAAQDSNTNLRQLAGRNDFVVLQPQAVGAPPDTRPAKHTNASNPRGRHHTSHRISCTPWR